MKNHAKVGNRPGRPAYRTASAFRNSVGIKLATIKASARAHRRFGK